MHELTIKQDEIGFSYGVCECGWTSPPCDIDELVVEFYGEHRAAESQGDDT